MATMKAFFRHTFSLFFVLVTLSSPIFTAPKQIKGKEKVIGLTISKAIAKGANVTLQCLEALKAMIHATKVVQDDDIDPLQNSTRLSVTPRLPRGGRPIEMDSNLPRTNGNLPIKANVRPSLQ